MMPVRTVIDRTAEVRRNIRQLADNEILIGIPAAQAPRPGSPINNAAIGYIQENGSPARNIPARPFLVPGVASIRKPATEQLRQAARDALDGKPAASLKVMKAVGLMGQNAVRARISSNIPPPLASATVRARLRKTKAGRKMRQQIRANLGAGEKMSDALAAWGAQNLTTLVDTTALRNAITFVVRKKGR
jgi:hypothetical protein